MINEKLKSINQDLINKIIGMATLELSKTVVNEEAKNYYDKGILKAEEDLNMNFFPDPERLKNIQDLTFNNIKGLNDFTASKLRSELEQGFINLESIDLLKKRVKKVMDVSIERARMIARTEMNRAMNMGHIDGARQSKLKLKKRWDSHLDSRTSNICRYLNGKTIGLNEKFVYEGKSFDAPPAHPNCRSTLVFVEENE